MDRATNTQIIYLFILLVVLCVISAVASEFWTKSHLGTDWYLGLDGTSRGRGCRKGRGCWEIGRSLGGGREQVSADCFLLFNSKSEGLCEG